MREKIIILGKGMGILAVISYFFYRSVWAFFLLSPYLIFYFRKSRRKIQEQKEEAFRYQFQDGIKAVSAALNAGYSVENAFREGKKDLSLLYDSEAPIMQEFQKIIRGLDSNERLEKLLFDFAGRWRIEEVESFAEIFSTAKETGGDFSLIIQTTAERISSRMEVKREIKTMIAAKKFEQKIMSLVPFFLMFYIDLTSPGFFSVLYGTSFGMIVMTVCLGVYLLSRYLSERIMQIQV
jgi:tight adherence protein B